MTGALHTARISTVEFIVSCDTVNEDSEVLRPVMKCER